MRETLINVLFSILSMQWKMFITELQNEVTITDENIYAWRHSASPSYSEITYICLTDIAIKFH